MHRATADDIRRRLAQLCLALALLVYPFFAHANPEGGVVAAGAATITTSINAVDIHQHSDKAIIDWRGFDIAPEERTEFHQPNAGSIALNRVHSTQASRINGRLKANGNIVIVNQNGVVFDKQAVVDVNGLLATSADIDDDRFMGDQPLRFDKAGASDAAVVNHGTITAKESGLVGFVAPNVENSGVITARLGRVQLASGDTATVDFYGDGLLEVAVSDRVVSQSVKHSGSIHADGGTIAMTAAAGSRVLRSSMEAGGTLRAQSVGVRGGKIIIAGGADKTQVRVAATIDASGKLAGDRAGAVHVVGNRIAVMAGTTIDASGVQGGGEILIGGDYHGQGYRGMLSAPVAAADWGNTPGGYSSLNGTTDAAFFADYYTREMGLGGPPTASRVFVDRDTTLLANALVAGNGGRVILWSDHGTTYDGHADVRAGALGGNGGFIEVSGKDWLNFSGTADASARMGEAGMLLLDPADITISTLANSNISGATPFQNNTASASSNLNVTTLQTALGSTNVTITSAAGTGGLGDITFLDPVSWNSAFALTVTSSNNIVVSGMISNAGAGNITLNANVAAAGSITINSNITTGGSITALANRDLTLANPATLTTGAAGALSLRAAGASTAGTGNLSLLGNLSVGTGNLTLLSGVNGTRPSFTATTTNLVPQSNFGTTSITGFNDLTIDRNFTGTGSITLTAMRDLTLNATRTITPGAAGAVSLNAANALSAGVGNFNWNGIISMGTGALTTVSGANGTRPSFTLTAANLLGGTMGAINIQGFNDFTIDRSITSSGNVVLYAIRDLTLNALRTITSGAAGSIDLRASSTAGVAGTGNLTMGGVLSSGTGGTTLLSGVNGTRPNLTVDAANFIPQSTFGAINIQGFTNLTIDRNITSSGSITLLAYRDLIVNAGRNLVTGAAGALSLRAAGGVTSGTGNLTLNGNPLSVGTGALTLLSGINGTRPSWTADATSLVRQGATFGATSITGFLDLTIDRDINTTGANGITLYAIRDLTLNAPRTLTTGATGALDLRAASTAGTAGTGNLTLNGNISMGSGALTMRSGINGTRPNYTMTTTNFVPQGATVGAFDIQGFNDFTVDRNITSSGAVTVVAFRDLVISATRTLATGAAAAMNLQAANGSTAGTGNLSILGNLSSGTSGLTLVSGANGTRPSWTANTTTLGRLGASFGAIAISGFQDFTISRDLNSSGNITLLSNRDMTLSAGSTVTPGAANNLSMRAANGVVGGTGNLTLLGNLSAGTGTMTLLSGINGTRPDWTATSTSFAMQGATVGTLDIQGFRDLTINRDIASSGNITMVGYRDLNLRATRTLTTGAAGALNLQAAGGAFGGTGNLNLNGNLSAGTGALTLLSGINGTRPTWIADTTTLNRQGASFGAVSIQGFNDVAINRPLNSTGNISFANNTRTVLLNNVSSTGGTITFSNAVAVGANVTVSTNNANIAFSSTINSIPIISTVQALVVAGGGGGGGGTGGGGGAGGLLYNAAIGVTAGTTNAVTVGSGGTGGGAYASGSTAAGNNGTNSVFSSLTAIGGGGGGANNSVVGRTGGSGGGGAHDSSGGVGTGGQGNSGGTGLNSASNYGASGGGGAGGAGTGGTTTQGGNGGAGTANTITGASVTYGGGGGGGIYNTATNFGLGGAGGGGNGGATGAAGSNGSNGLGGGGGGAGNNNTSGGTGGSGVVIVRYTGTSASAVAVGGTATTTGGDTVWTFNSSGSFTPVGCTGNCNLTVNSGTGTTTFSGVVGGTTALRDLSVTADNVTISGSMSGIGNVSIAPSTAGRAVLVATGNGDTSTAGGLNLSNAEVTRLANGWSSLTFGSLTAGDVTNTRTTFSDPVNFISGNDFINSAVITTADPVFVNAVRDVTLNNNITSTNTTANATVLVAGRNFINSTGGGALTTGAGGRWLVYSTNPTGTTGEGTMSNAFNRYTCSYGGACPTLGAGNGFLYSYTPTLAVTVSGQTYNYGDAVLAPGGYTILTAGYLNALDSAQGTITGTGNFGTSYAQGDNAGTNYSIIDLGSTFASNIGYGFSLSTPTGTVGQRSISITANNQTQTYGFGALNPGLFTVSSGSLYGADAISDVTLTTDATTSGSGEYTYRAAPWLLTPSAAVFSTGLGANYAITYLDASTGLTINRRALTLASITASDKVYDGLTSATLSGYTLDNPVSGDTISVTGLAGIFDSKDVGTRNVTASAGALTGADAGNYAFTLGSVATTADITAATNSAPSPATVSTIPDSILRGGAYGTYSLSHIEDAVYATPNTGYLLTYLPSTAPSENRRHNRPVKTYKTSLNASDEEERLKKYNQAKSPQRPRRYPVRATARSDFYRQADI